MSSDNPTRCMKLEAPDGNFFSMNVERYEYPDEELGPTEDNPADEFDTGRFLVVSYTFRNAQGEWHASGPTMDTLELARFADWIDSIRDGRPSSNGVYFTERDLEFSIDDELHTLRVHVFSRFRPNWVTSETGLTIPFPLDQIDVDAASQSLRQQIAAFPGRPTVDDA